jgi:hypothetical protein
VGVLHTVAKGLEYWVDGLPFRQQHRGKLGAGFAKSVEAVKMRQLACFVMERTGLAGMFGFGLGDKEAGEGGLRAGLTTAR